MSSTHPPTLSAAADERDADAARVPDSVEVDAALVDNVLATLRGLQWPSLITAVVFSALLWRQRGGPWPLIWAPSPWRPNWRGWRCCAFMHGR